MVDSQLSLTETGAISFTTTEQFSPSLFTDTFAGHVIIGISISLTVTVKEQLAELPLASLAIYLTVLTPELNEVPLASFIPFPVVVPEIV